MQNVSIIIVSMNHPEVLAPCLDSIRNNTNVPYETFIVAYMYTAENLLKLRNDYPWVKIVESNELRGFSENNNIALRQAQGRYCFIVNDDTYFDGPLIDSLAADFDRLPDNAAVVSPKLVFPDGRIQLCGRRKLTCRTYMSAYLHRLNETKPTKYTMKEGLFRTYNLSGACFLIKTDVFRKMGWFDETYTFTPEDVALGTKLNKEGYGVYCDADLKLTHISGNTASRLETAIKPTRVRGSLIFYSKGNPVRYFLLGSFVWLAEAYRGIKYAFRDKSDADSHNAIMAATASNVRHSIFTKKTTKQIFIGYYNEIKK
ncbi:MAG: glycosyltransferase [Bacteroidales bacterium]|jgi:GT2 family glycosyltransferase|nr:glycosyltransferase [Bacteroidales bacterium]MCI2133782.1 glycosyltransferase [Bacteroidales bacterium]